MRRELLNAYLFNNLSEVRELSQEWRIDYNEERPHKSLGYLSPIMYAEKYMSRTAIGNTIEIEGSRSREKENEKRLKTLNYTGTKINKGSLQLDLLSL
jgi:hypothetical protein